MEFSKVPEINDRIYALLVKINDECIRKYTMYLLNTENYLSYGTDVLMRPSSTPEDECCEWGTLLHIERVVCCCEELCNAYDVKKLYRDKLISAAILHDRWLYMKDIVPHETMGFIKCCEHKEMVDVGYIILAHEGEWGSESAKEIIDQMRDSAAIKKHFVIRMGELLHIADYICSRRSLWKKMQHV